jgi:hypothetical protein
MATIQASLRNATAYFNLISLSETEAGDGSLAMYLDLQERLSVLSERYSNLLAASGLEEGGAPNRKANRLSRRKGATKGEP